TGLDVDTHGVPGVVFRIPEHASEPINIFQYSGPVELPRSGNIFSDAAARGYRPIALAGDLDDVDCTWRSVLLEHAQRIGKRYCTLAGASDGPLDPSSVVRRMESDIRTTLASEGSNHPVLIWCFVDLDRIIHVRGYDNAVLRILASIDALASGLAA